MVKGQVYGDMIKSKKIQINPIEENTALALKMTDEFIRNEGLAGKNAIHFRLLTEVTLGMVGAMKGDFIVRFWIEKEESEYRICLSSDRNMVQNMQNQLTYGQTGDNLILGNGIMSMIGAVFEYGCCQDEDVRLLRQEYESGCVEYGAMGLSARGEMGEEEERVIWSLGNYREALAAAAAADDSEKVAWNELEASIITSLARDVVVEVKKDTVDLIIFYPDVP